MHICSIVFGRFLMLGKLKQKNLQNGTDVRMGDQLPVGPMAILTLVWHCIRLRVTQFSRTGHAGVESYLTIQVALGYLLVPPEGALIGGTVPATIVPASPFGLTSYQHTSPGLPEPWAISCHSREGNI